MKAGILEADKVLTVSPYYAEELISGVARGCELDNIMRLTGITGIVNGMDVSEWDPSKDKYIATKYDVSTVSFQFHQTMHPSVLLAQVFSASDGPLDSATRLNFISGHRGQGAQQGGAAGRCRAPGRPEDPAGGVRRQAGGAEGPRRHGRRHPAAHGGGRPDRSSGTYVATTCSYAFRLQSSAC